MDRKKPVTGQLVDEAPIKKDTRFTGSDHPIIWWIYETASHGKNGMISIQKAAFDARAEAGQLLHLDYTKLTIVKGTKTSVPCKVELPLIGEIITLVVKPNGKRNGKSLPKMLRKARRR